MEEAHQGSRRSRFLNKFRKSGKISPNTDASVQTVVAGEGTIDGITIITQDSGNEAPLVEKRATTSRLPLDCKDERVEAYDDAKQDENSYFRPKTLWERACDEVENSEEFKAFIIQYQKILLSQDPQDDVLSLASRKNGMGKLIEQQKKTLEEGRWGFILLGRSFKVAEVVSKIIKGIIKIEGTLQTILRGSGEPHAAMIVAGVSILLPLITHPDAQDKSAMELLGEIFDRTLRYHVYEEILESPHIGQDDSENVQQLRTRMRDRLVLLYAEILKAQIALARRFARSSFLQYGRDIVKFDSWISMSEEIMKRDADLVVDIQTLDIILGQTLVRQYNNLEADYRGLYSLVESQAQITKDKQNQEFLQFFASTFSYQSTADKVDNPIKGTNEWIGRDSRFIAWRDAKESATMLIKAGAGRGKSVLLKHLLQNDLASSFRRLTLYFFFHSGSDLERSAVESMNAIIFQLLEQRPDMVRNVREGFPNVNASTRYHFELLCNIIQYCIHDFEGEVVLVLDGLDECEVLESPSGLSQRISVTTQADDHRQNLVKFFDWLGLLARTKTKKAHVKILCSTRTGADTAYHTSIAFKCQERNEIDLNAEVANSRSDLALYIKAKVCRPNIDEKKQEALASMLIELQKTSGSYLWLKLVFAILQRPKYETMSVDSFKNYLIQGEMDKVDKQFSALLPTEPEQQAMAKVIFSIILGSRRSLTTAELCGAVQAVVGEYIELDRPDVLADYCSAFVEINTTRRSNMSTTADEAPETKRIVDFFHDRARTFLLVTSQVPERLAPSSTTVSFLQSALSVMGVSQPKQIVEIRQRPTGFHHGFSNEYADGFMLETCVKYIQQKGLTGSIDNNLKFMQSHEKITDWISKYLKDNPFMVYAAIQWINHLPFDDKNRDLQARVSQQVHNLLDVTSQPFRTWFICNWRIWSPDMPMEMFFRQYVTAFITDNLQPSKKIRAEFKLEDPGVRGAWLWWTNNGDLSGLKNFMTMCNPDYERPQPSRQWISSYESTSMATEFRPEYERTTFD